MAISKEVRPGDVQSIHRAMHLLEAVGAAGDLGVTEIAAELSLAVSTVHNMLRTLVHRGYLVNLNGRYRLGPAVTVLASQWDPALSLSSSVRHLLPEISSIVGHASYATVLVGREGQLIGFQAGPGPVTSSAPDFSTEDPMSLATGRVMVAMTRQHEWPSFIKASQVVPRRSLAQWTQELQQIRDTGICVKVEETTIVVVGVPVWTSNDSVICSIGAAVPTYLATNDFIELAIDTLWAASTELSGELGCSELPLPKPEPPIKL